jgi:hypothetical protein
MLDETPLAKALVVPSIAHTLLGAPYEPPLVSTDEEFSLHAPASSVDKKDQDTPDAWIPR